jgi:hypothetical protein
LTRAAEERRPLPPSRPSKTSEASRGAAKRLGVSTAAVSHATGVEDRLVWSSQLLGQSSRRRGARRARGAAAPAVERCLQLRGSDYSAPPHPTGLESRWRAKPAPEMKVVPETRGGNRRGLQWAAPTLSRRGTASLRRDLSSGFPPCDAGRIRAYLAGCASPPSADRHPPCRSRTDRSAGRPSPWPRRRCRQ